MTDSPRATALAAIQAARLKPTTERNALRLLEWAAEENGSVHTTFAAMRVLFEVGSDRSIRTHLTALLQANIIHYDTNDWVFVTFKAWPPVQELRVGAQELRVGAQLGTDDDDPANSQLRVGAQELRVGYTNPARGRAEKTHIMNECVSESFNSPLPEKNSLNHSISDDEQKRSAAILTDPAIGLMNRDVLAEVIRLRPFEEIRAFCCDLFAEGKPNGTYAGLVVSRIRTGASVPALYHNDLYRRHMTPAEIAAEEERQAQAAEEERRWQEEQAARATVTAASPSGVDQSPWDAAKGQLAVSLPAATYDRWVKATTLLAVEDGCYRVGVPDAYVREWLDNRLKPQAQRILSKLAGGAVDVRFEVRA